MSGAKNSVLKLQTASLLTGEPVRIRNYPATLLDAQVHVGMLEALGKRCAVDGDELTVTEPASLKSDLSWEGRSIRNTLLILGALTARTGRADVPAPGGCKLGERGCDLHELVLRRLGAEVSQEGDRLLAKTAGRLTGADIHLPLRSTGATENAMLCASLADGVTRIWGPHIRPEIIDLAGFLNKMGARIRIFGQEHIEVTGVERLSGTLHTVIPDNMEALTWLIASVVTDGDVEIVNFPTEHVEVPLIFLRESGARFYASDHRLIARGGTCYPVDISTGPFPGINSDMQPLFATYAARAVGLSKIVDLRFPGRYAYAPEMAKMGLVSSLEGNLLQIHGNGRLEGATVRAVDLRAGVALTLAGLFAEGETTVTDAWQVERGYDRFVDKMTRLGGRIERRCD